MPSVKFTVDDIPESTFPPLPEDEVFLFEVSAAEVKRSGKGPYANLKLVVKDHPVYSNRIVWEILALPDEVIFEAMISHPIESEKRKLADAIGSRCFRLRQALLAMGFPKGEGVELVDGGGGQKSWNVDALLNKTFQEKEEATAKLQRAQLSSTQLPTYYVGWKEWRRLLEARQKAQNFQIAQFHERALRVGAVPMPALAKLLP